MWSSFGRLAASSTRGPQFESSHQEFVVFTHNRCKDANEKKWPGIVHQKVDVNIQI